MNRVADPNPIYDRKLDSARQYWMNALSVNHGDAMLPTDRSGRGQRKAEGPLALTISGVTFERLMRMTAGSPLLLYVTLLTAAKVCIYKYSRSRVITVGAPPRGIEGGLPGPSHALAIVDRVDGETPFRTLLLNVKETVVEAYQYQDNAPGIFVDDLTAGEQIQLQPQVSLSVRDFHGDFSPLRSDITLRFERRETEVNGTVDYDSLLFSPALSRRFIGDFSHVLSRALEGTTISVRDLAALTPSERDQLIWEWNNTSQPYPENHCVHELFTLQVSAAPDAVAVIYGDQHLTYLELNGRANRLAHYLIRGGVKPETRVALHMKRGLETVVGILGVLKAGGVYVPLDANYPPERLAYMAHDARAEILLTQRRLLDSLTLPGVRAVCLDEEWERIREEGEEAPDSEVRAQNLAYVIYTSGSTGRPKGVMVEHKGLCNLVEAQKKAFRLGDQARVLQFASCSFDASVSEIFTTLTAGGRLHMRAQERLMPGDDLARALKEDQITAVTLPLSALAVLPSEDLPNLQTVIAAGEACSADIVDQWARGRLFLDAYGPTEATVCASIGECEAGSGERPTIGRPMANSGLYCSNLGRERRREGGLGEPKMEGLG